MQYGFYFDQNRCTGCYTCVVACRDWHDVPAGPANWLRLKTIEKGKYPDLFVSFLPLACYHCHEPACVNACPTNAINKRGEDGIVTVDADTCMGKDSCGLCLEACPYDVPQFGAEENARMQKCDLCLDRLAEGNKPVCVEACPMWALDAGPMDELREKYGDIREAEGFVYSELAPSISFKPRKDNKGLMIRKVEIKPSSEVNT
jgi:anaerobic dimethyl sulfoxide reductase subunit B (iron-sulfur subunit)